jgi:hypothetical protein
MAFVAIVLRKGMGAYDYKHKENGKALHGGKGKESLEFNVQSYGLNIISG